MKKYKKVIVLMLLALMMIPNVALAGSSNAALLTFTIDDVVGKYKFINGLDNSEYKTKPAKMAEFKKFGRHHNNTIFGAGVKTFWNDNKAIAYSSDKIKEFMESRGLIASLTLTGQEDFTYTFPAKPLVHNNSIRSASDYERNLVKQMGSDLTSGLNRAMNMIKPSNGYKDAQHYLSYAERLTQMAFNAANGNGGKVSDTFDGKTVTVASAGVKKLNGYNNKYVNITVDNKHEEFLFEHDTQYRLVSDKYGTEIYDASKKHDLKDFKYVKTPDGKTYQIINDGLGEWFKSWTSIYKNYDNAWYKENEIATSINWKHVVLQSEINLMNGLTGSATIVESKSNPLTKAIVGALDALLDGVKKLVKIPNLSDLVYNRGTRAITEGSDFYLGAFKTAWLPTIFDFFIFFQILAGLMVFVGLAKMLFLRNLATVNPAIRVSLKEEFMYLILTGLLASTIWFIIKIMLVFNANLASLIGAKTGYMSIESAGNIDNPISAVIMRWAWFGISLYVYITYVLRSINIAFLSTTAPIFAASMSLGVKFRGMFGNWMRELTSNIFLQTFHAGIFVLLVKFQAHLDIFESLIMAYSIIPLTEVLRSLFMSGKTVGTAHKIGNTGASIGKGAMAGIGGLAGGFALAGAAKIGKAGWDGAWRAGDGLANKFGKQQGGAIGNNMQMVPSFRPVGEDGKKPGGGSEMLRISSNSPLDTRLGYDPGGPGNGGGGFGGGPNNPPGGGSGNVATGNTTTGNAKMKGIDRKAQIESMFSRGANKAKNIGSNLQDIKSQRSIGGKIGAGMSVGKSAFKDIKASERFDGFRNGMTISGDQMKELPGIGKTLTDLKTVENENGTKSLIETHAQTDSNQTYFDNFLNAKKDNRRDLLHESNGDIEDINYNYESKSYDVQYSQKYMNDNNVKHAYARNNRHGSKDFVYEYKNKDAKDMLNAYRANNFNDRVDLSFS